MIPILSYNASMLCAVLSTVLVGMTSTANAADFPPPPPTAEQMARLEAGDFLQSTFYAMDENGNPRGYSTGTVLIYRPVQEVWNVVCDVERYDEFFHSINETQVLRKLPRRSWTHYRTSLSMLEPEFDLIQEFDEVRRLMTYRLDPDKPVDYFDFMEGYWYLSEVAPNRTVAVYHFATAIDLPLLDWLIQPLVERIAESSMPKVLHALKRRVESEGQWRKETVVAVNPPRLDNQP